jgi:predicted DNA-binding transcriptional regulator YafY
MRADRISQFLEKLRLRPGMGAAQLLDEIEASAPEATLE